MKVLYERFHGGDRFPQELHSILEPRGDGSGQLEYAIALAEKNAAMLGKLAATLVEHGVVSLDEAFKASGRFGNVFQIPEEPLNDLELQA